MPRKWLNVYSPLDVLSSNFRNDEKEDEADSKIDLINVISLKPENIVYQDGSNENIGWWDWLLLIRVRCHSRYWEGQEDEEISCLYYLISPMYEGDSILS